MVALIAALAPEIIDLIKTRRREVDPSAPALTNIEIHTALVAFLQSEEARDIFLLHQYDEKIGKG